MRILAALLLLPVVLGSNQICADGTQCSNTDTCCRMADGSYGCCPLVDATCCADLRTCCPSNEVCFLGYCWGAVGGNTSLSKAIPLIVKSDDIVCPDGESSCPDDTTCCKNPPRQTPDYGCCPMTDAVCCDDGIHCCPSGTTCDVAEGKCQGDGYITEMYRKKPHGSRIGLAPIRLSSGPAANHVCNGTAVRCTDSNTCCLLLSGEYGCCPFANAHCCEDKIHCCPEDMHCDATSQYCSQGSVNGTTFRKAPAQNILHERHRTCPDKTTCGSEDTCCEVSDGKFGCCPYVNATCCADDLHCCPSGTRCTNSGCVDESWIYVHDNEIPQN